MFGVREKGETSSPSKGLATHTDHLTSLCRRSAFDAVRMSENRLDNNPARINA